MHCPSCGFDNPEEMKFCGQCASPLSRRCRQCGFENPPGFAFCGQCASRLTAEVQSPKSPVQSLEAQPSPTERASSTGERRQLTVMFCDLVGSTPLSEKLDPEELREVILAYQEVCAQVIRRFEGHLARYLGDGLLVYFGYPRAHEDDAQRAVRAGLEIVAALPQLNTRLQQTVRVLQQLPLQIRIGIHTGLVVVSDMGGGGYRDPMAIVGETPNIAARLQGIAEPDTVVISAATYRLTQGYFECRDLGPQELKGVSTPISVYRVLSEGGLQSRFEVRITTGLTPLVGREEELGLLLRRWEKVRESEGQVVLLSGEAGIGKSRLLRELREQLASEPQTRLECRCSPYYQNSALYPVIDLLQRMLEFSRDDSPEEKLKKLEDALVVGAHGQRKSQAEAVPLQTDAIPLFASLLSLPLPEGRYPPLTLTPQKQKEKTQQALLSWLLETTAQQPVRLDVEDLHWADPSTLELLGLFMDQVPTARIFLLLTFRPEFRPPWAVRSHLTQLTLSRLGRKQAEALVEKAAGGKALPPDVLQQIVSKTDGVPLFVEELTKTVLESDLYVGATHASPVPSLAIPATLHDSLMARLDRLGAAKEVAQLGATLGREFSYELLQSVSPVDEASLQQALAKLVEAEVLYQRGLPPQVHYIFKHALIQDAAYQSLLKSTRQQYHQQIAQVLEKRFPETKETQPELVAHHYTEAGLIAQAIPYWQRAGERAVQRSANMEAVSHLTKGLELLKILPDTPARTQQELTLQIALGAPLMITKGPAASEVEQTYTRALKLCQQVGETPQLFLVLRGLWNLYVARGELQRAQELGEQVLRLAQSVQDLGHLMLAHLMLGATLYFLGELAPAREHLERATALYDDPGRPRPPWGWVDSGVISLSYAAAILWLLGYPDQALKRSHEALTLAQELSHPFNLAYALHFAAQLHQYRREGQTAQERAEVLIALSSEQGFLLWMATGTVLRGWALAERGQGEEGITQIRQGMDASRATGAELERPYLLFLLAEAYGKVGQTEEGLSALAEALTLVNKTGERRCEAELYRLKGTLMLQSKTSLGQVQDKSAVTNPRPLTPDPQGEAEACFQKAIDIARKQEAKSWELRASTSLARLWQQQGRKAEARQMLAEIYGWFTEGFDTADLREAKALLEEFSSM